MDPDDAVFEAVVVEWKIQESLGLPPDVITAESGSETSSAAAANPLVSPSCGSSEVSSDAAPPLKRTSATATTVNLINASLGSGILSLPWATAGSSLFVSVGLTFLVLALNGVTNMILVVAAERSQCFDLGNLLGKMPTSWSRVARAFVDLIIWISVFVGLVGYYLIAEDSFGPFWPSQWVSPWCGRVASLTLSTAVVLPLCFLDQSRLALSSSFCIAANLFLFGVVLVAWYWPRLLSSEEAAAVADRACLLGWGRGAVTMATALMQAIILQMCVLPMFEARRYELGFASSRGV
jgi:hypothetical protein